MTELRIELNGGRTNFRSGELVRGIAKWELTDGDVRAVELRLFWYTEGKGDQDIEIVHVERFDVAGTLGEEPFAFRLPMQPYSFSGKLITLQWALELLPGSRARRAHRVEIVVSPTGDEILLGGLS